jgi:hypothetical protein
MLRNCVVAVVIWIALAVGYEYLLRDIPGAGKYFGALAMATVVGIGLAIVTGVRFTLRDWSARRRMARGERPRDGDLAAATGPVHPAFESLRAPFSGRECVLYSYEIGLPHSGEGRPARDYVGFGMTRCAVRTPYGEFALGSFPVLEHFFETEVDRALADEYLATTAFEQPEGVAGIVKAMFGVHTTAPPLRKDWKIGETAAALDDAEVVEKILAPGDTITAIGRYVAASNAIMSDTKEKGFLRVRRGGDALHVPSVPWNAIGAFIGGTALIAIANAVFLYLRAHPPQ